MNLICRNGLNFLRSFGLKFDALFRLIRNGSDFSRFVREVDGVPAINSLNFISNSNPFFAFSAKDDVRVIDSLKVTVWRDSDNVEFVDLPELICFSHCGPGHTTKFVV